ncbi:mitochondrial rho GTPase 1 [Stemphylium lycopersici]|nr:mitochondrial rho GTPase 1 [Stemphylium lycopersici]
MGTRELSQQPKSTKSPEKQKSQGQSEEAENSPIVEEDRDMGCSVSDGEDWEEMSLGDDDSSIEEVEGPTGQESQLNNDADVEMEEFNQPTTEAEQEDAGEEEIHQTQPKAKKGTEKTRTSKPSTSPWPNSTNPQTTEPAETPTQHAQNAALVAEIKRNWGVSSFRDFIPTGTWLLGKTNIRDNEWSLETLRGFRNLSTLDRSTDDAVKKEMRKKHRDRGHQGKGKDGYKVGKLKGEKEKNLQVDLKELYEEFNGKRRAAGDQTAGDGNARKRVRTADGAEDEDGESSGLTPVSQLPAEDWLGDTIGTLPVDGHRKDKGKGKARADAKDDQSSERLSHVMGGTAATAADGLDLREVIEQGRRARRSTRQTTRPARYQGAVRAPTLGPSSAAPQSRGRREAAAPQSTGTNRPSLIADLNTSHTARDAPTNTAQPPVPRALNPNATANIKNLSQSRELVTLDARARLANAALQEAESEWMLARARRAEIAAGLLGGSYEEAYREVLEASVRVDMRWADYLEIDARRVAITEGLEEGDDEDSAAAAAAADDV